MIACNATYDLLFLYFFSENFALERIHMTENWMKLINFDGFLESARVRYYETTFSDIITVNVQKLEFFST